MSAATQHTRKISTGPTSLALVFACTALATGSPTSHTLILRNGDRLQGQVSTYSDNTSLNFTHPNALAPLQFRSDAIMRLENALDSDASSPGANATLSLSDGNTWPVTIEAFDGKLLRLALPWANQNTSVPWDKVVALEFMEGPRQFLLQGPSSQQAWQFITDKSGSSILGRKPSQKNRGWYVENHTLIGSTPGSASLDAAMPDRLCIEWDLQWTSSLNFCLGLYSDAFMPVAVEDNAPAGIKNVWQKMESDGQIVPQQECIALEFNPHAVLVQLHSKDNGQDMLASAQVPVSLRSENQARFKVLVDRKSGSLYLYINQKLVQKWPDLGEFTSRGRALSLWQHHDSGSIHLRRLRLSQWDGRPIESRPVPEKEKDIVIARDGNRLSGKFTKVTNAAWLLDGSLGEISIAEADIRHIIRPLSLTTSRPSPQSFAVTLNDGFQLSLMDVKILENARLSGKHEILGPIEFPLKFLESLTFPDVPAPQP